MQSAWDAVKSGRVRVQQAPDGSYRVEGPPHDVRAMVAAAEKRRRKGEKRVKARDAQPGR